MLDIYVYHMACDQFYSLQRKRTSVFDIIIPIVKH